mmetsp:Transcript_3969/g.6095  ORF Transcript_3969/g.6095 Transcript_3969/m.6095 type:complete len:304 (+) Transcript_3969:167-1078(+)
MAESGPAFDGPTQKEDDILARFFRHKDIVTIVGLLNDAFDERQRESLEALRALQASKVQRQLAKGKVQGWSVELHRIADQLIKVMKFARFDRFELSGAMDMKVAKRYSGPVILSELVPSMRHAMEAADKFPVDLELALAEYRKYKFDHLQLQAPADMPGYEAWAKNQTKHRPAASAAVGGGGASSSSSVGSTQAGVLPFNNPQVQQQQQQNAGNNKGGKFRGRGGGNPGATKEERHTQSNREGNCPGCEWPKRQGGANLVYDNCPNTGLFDEHHRLQPGVGMPYKAALNARKAHSDGGPAPSA